MGAPGDPLDYVANSAVAGRLCPSTEPFFDVVRRCGLPEGHLGPHQSWYGEWGEPDEDAEEAEMIRAIADGYTDG